MRVSLSWATEIYLEFENCARVKQFDYAQKRPDLAVDKLWKSGG